jgi:spoIIIJ-associated protein
MENVSTGADWLKELLQLMGYSASVKQISAEAFSKANHNSNANPLSLPESQNYWLEISHSDLQPSQIQNIIGEEGAVIDGIQYLANVILNHHAVVAPQELPHDHYFYTVELNNYRSSHLASLQALTEQAVEQVRDTGTEFVIKNLSAADRRYVHHLLDSCTDIENFSQGREPHRYLIVKLVTNNGKDLHTADC